MYVSPLFMVAYSAQKPPKDLRYIENDGGAFMEFWALSPVPREQVLKKSTHMCLVPNLKCN